MVKNRYRFVDDGFIIKEKVIKGVIMSEVQICWVGFLFLEFCFYFIMEGE